MTPQILTVTLNPALDVTYAVDAVTIGATHRVRQVAVRAGGKGLNVARVLRALGGPVAANGLLGGENGRRIAGLLDAAGVPADFVPIAAESRRTVVVTDGAEATGFWEPGPEVSAADWESFLGRDRESLTGVAAVVLAGSLPRGVSDDTYVRRAPWPDVLADAVACSAAAVASPVAGAIDPDDVRRLRSGVLVEEV